MRGSNDTAGRKTLQYGKYEHNIKYVAFWRAIEAIKNCASALYCEKLGFENVFETVNNGK